MEQNREEQAAIGAVVQPRIDHGQRERLDDEGGVDAERMIRFSPQPQWRVPEAMQGPDHETGGQRRTSGLEPGKCVPAPADLLAKRAAGKVMNATRKIAFNSGTASAAVGPPRVTERG